MADKRPTAEYDVQYVKALEESVEWARAYCEAMSYLDALQDSLNTLNKVNADISWGKYIPRLEGER